MNDLDIAIRNADTIFEAAKRLKAIRNRYETKADAERRARKELANLQTEAHTLTTAMVNGEDTSHLRDLAGIQKAMKGANNLLDKAVGKGQDERDEALEAYQKLLDAMYHEVMPDDAVDADDQEQEAA